MPLVHPSDCITVEMPAVLADGSHPGESPQGHGPSCQYFGQCPADGSDSTARACVRLKSVDSQAYGRQSDCQRSQGSHEGVTHLLCNTETTVYSPPAVPERDPAQELCSAAFVLLLQETEATICDSNWRMQYTSSLSSHCV